VTVDVVDAAEGDSVAEQAARGIGTAGSVLGRPDVVPTGASLYVGNGSANSMDGGVAVRRDNAPTRAAMMASLCMVGTAWHNEKR